MPKVTHFEFTTPDPDAEKSFFGDVFGWTFEGFGGSEYWLATTGPADGYGINGAIMTPPMPGAPRVTNTIGVGDIDTTIEMALAAGATIANPKREVPGIGWLAYLVSPTGIAFGVLQPLPGSMP